MALTNTTTGSGLTTVAAAFTPQEFGELVNVAVQAQSIAARSALPFIATRDRVSFPKWLADPAVGFYDELDEIDLEDASTDEVSTNMYKTAGLTLISNELKEDSDPKVLDLVGAALANKIARSVDGAYLADTTTKGPDGLLSLEYSSVDTGEGLANLDPFIEARYAAEANNSTLTSWIVSAETAEVIAKLKTASGSNQNLVEFVADGLRVAGLPVLVSNQVDVDTLFWGLDKQHVRFILRQGTTVEQFPAVERDGTYVRAVARFAFAFLNEPGIVRGYPVPESV